MQEKQINIFNKIQTADWVFFPGILFPTVERFIFFRFFNEKSLVFVTEQRAVPKTAFSPQFSDSSYGKLLPDS